MVNLVRTSWDKERRARAIVQPERKQLITRFLVTYLSTSKIPNTGEKERKKYQAKHMELCVTLQHHVFTYYSVYLSYDI